MGLNPRTSRPATSDRTFFCRPLDLFARPDVGNSRGTSSAPFRPDWYATDSVSVQSSQVVVIPMRSNSEEASPVGGVQRRRKSGVEQVRSPGNWVAPWIAHH